MAWHGTIGNGDQTSLCLPWTEFHFVYILMTLGSSPVYVPTAAAREEGTSDASAAEDRGLSAHQVT